MAQHVGAYLKRSSSLSHDCTGYLECSHPRQRTGDVWVAQRKGARKPHQVHPPLFTMGSSGGTGITNFYQNQSKKSAQMQNRARSRKRGTKAQPRPYVRACLVTNSVSKVTRCTPRSQKAASTASPFPAGCQLGGPRGVSSPMERGDALITPRPCC